MLIYSTAVKKHFHIIHKWLFDASTLGCGERGQRERIQYWEAMLRCIGCETEGIEQNGERKITRDELEQELFYGYIFLYPWFLR